MGACKHECGSWKGLLQMVVYLVSRGYYFWHITYLPLRKKEKWQKIDEKLMRKYKTQKSKWQRLREKQKGLANFYYLRWENVMVIMHTKGDIGEDIIYDDKFYDIRKKPVELQVSELVGFRIECGDKVTVKLSKETYAGIKRALSDVARLKDQERMKREFDKLNGFPAWGGIIEQKRKLAKYLVKQAQKHQVSLKESDLRITSYRKPVRVWK